MQDEAAPPAKRPRLESDGPAPDAKTAPADITTSNQVESSTTSKSVNADTVQKEAKAGIVAFVNPDHKGFSGVLKQRFLVPIT